LVIKSISLTNFRSFTNISLSFDDRGAVFYGKNGIGKTNLLEAICFFAYGKSFSAPSDLDLVKRDTDYFHIKGEFLLQQRKFLFEASFDNKARKLIKVNNQRLQRVSDLYKYLKIVYFSHDDINLIEGSPKRRRQFFDLAISQSNLRYLERYKDYSQILKHRNALLKTDYAQAEKKVWDSRLIECAADITNARLEYIKKLNTELKKHYAKIGYSQEDVAIEYQFSFKMRKESELKEVFASELRRVEREEKLYQRTMIGPHLDDYNFTLNDQNINRFGSFGQKRCFAIAIKLGMANLLSKNDKEEAILIFDDVLSDLDEQRTKCIIDSLGMGNQIFVATPSPAPYKALNLSFIDLENRIGNPNIRDES